jgi:acyl carrier protein
MDSQEGGTDVREHIRDFIRENYLYMHPDVQFGDGDNLLGLGLVDSLAFVELVEHVQTRYKFEVQDREITEENFGSVDGIALFIESKQGR